MKSRLEVHTLFLTSVESETIEFNDDTVRRIVYVSRNDSSSDSRINMYKFSREDEKLHRTVCGIKGPQISLSIMNRCKN